ncbi:MAG TPA: DUF3800 domain-containing protein [Terriglobales bacterium]|nr:DUF3800 domain-containing protein [Terriglobales bacterium]
MFEAYFDESGIHKGAAVCVVAGFYGSHSSWRAMESQWSKVLSNEDVEEFHAKEFWGRHSGKRIGQYAGWDEERAERFLSRLVRVIERNRIFPCAHAVAVDDWLALDLADRRHLTGGRLRNRRWVRSGSPEKSYYIPFQFSLVDSLQTVQQLTHYAFDIDKDFSRHALHLYQELKAASDFPHRHFMGNCLFPSSKDTPGLQAADLFAYLTYKHYVAFVRDKKPPRPDAILIRLLRNKKADQKFTMMRKENFYEVMEMEKTRQEAYQKLQNQPPSPFDLEHSSGTSHRGMKSGGRTVFRHCQYIAPKSEKLAASDIVRVGSPVFDPRKADF